MLSIVLVQHIGSTGVIAGTILSYLLVLVVPQSMIVRSVLRTTSDLNEAAGNHASVQVEHRFSGAATDAIDARL